MVGLFSKLGPFWGFERIRVSGFSGNARLRMVRSSGFPSSASPKFVIFWYSRFRGSGLEGSVRFRMIRSSDFPSSAISKFVIFGFEREGGSGLIGNVRFVPMIRGSPSSKFVFFGFDPPTLPLISLYNLEFRISFFISSLIAFFSILASNLD